MALPQRLHRRDELRHVAARMFSARGYHGTSMADLASGLGILRGSLYAHIDTKEDLLYDIVDRGADRFLTRLEEVVASDSSPLDKVHAAVRAHVETIAEHTEASTVFLNEWRFLSPERRDTILAKRKLYQSLIEEVIEEGVEWGAFPEDLDPKFAAIFLLSTVNWLYQWYDPSGRYSPAELSEILSAMILKGIEGRKS